MLAATVDDVDLKLELARNKARARDAYLCPNMNRAEFKLMPYHSLS